MLKTYVSDAQLLRYSLAFVWLATTVVSLMEWHGQSRDLLAAGGVREVNQQSVLIAAGALADAVLGVLLLACPRRWVYAACGVLVLLMTVVASVLLPALWLHPLGPLTKNIALLAALWVLYRNNHFPAQKLPAQLHNQ